MAGRADPRRARQREEEAVPLQVRGLGWDSSHDEWHRAAEVGAEAIAEFEAGLVEGERAAERFASEAEREKAMLHAQSTRDVVATDLLKEFFRRVPDLSKLSTGQLIQYKRTSLFRQAVSNTVLVVNVPTPKAKKGGEDKKDCAWGIALESIENARTTEEALKQAGVSSSWVAVPPGDAYVPSSSSEPIMFSPVDVFVGDSDELDAKRIGAHRRFAAAVDRLGVRRRCCGAAAPPAPSPHGSWRGGPSRRSRPSRATASA